MSSKNKEISDLIKKISEILQNPMGEGVLHTLRKFFILYKAVWMNSF